jgi:chemotaxis protein methyltransferase CheR
MEEIYDKVLDILKSRFNSNLNYFDEVFVNKTLEQRIDETGCTSSIEYANLLLENDDEAINLLNALHIGYSEFFRNPLTFAVLEKIILPELTYFKNQNGHQEIRIWSAACSSGQEVYSLAMLFEELNVGTNKKLIYRIFASDRSENQLKEAQKGQYPVTLLNNISLKRAQLWFDQKGNYYSVNPELKGNIHFSVFDLLNDQLHFPTESIYGDFDIVLCANLLFYYKPEIRKIILEKVANCLATDGYIVVGETERDILMRNDYQEVFPQTGIFRK